jgi:hypothetical protein
MKRRWLLLFALVGVLAVMIFAITASLLNPLRKPPDQIRAYLLARTPLGTKKDDVRVLLQEKRWQRFPEKPESGAFSVYRRRHNGSGSRAIYAELGGYQGFPWWVSVSAIWVFDEEGKLIDVDIHKIHDSP